MMSACNALMTALLGTVFPAWLECDAIQYLLGFAVIGIVIKLLISLCKF